MKTLIAIDSSDMAEKILSQVCEAMWSADVEFRIISVIDTGKCPEKGEQFFHQTQLLLCDRVERIRSKLAPHKIEFAVLAGALPDVIIDDAKEQKCDLLIIGSHGQTGCRRPELGSVAAELVKQAPCTVQVLKLCANKELVDSKAAVQT